MIRQRKMKKDCSASCTMKCSEVFDLAAIMGLLIIAGPCQTWLKSLVSLNPELRKTRFKGSRKRDLTAKKKQV